MNIRKWTASDIPFVCRIDENAFKNPWSTAFFEDELAKDYAYCCIIENDGEPCGYAVIWCIYETAELIRIAVDKKYQKSGIGSMLMEDILKYCEKAGCEKMMLEVRKGNAAAQALYLKSGFKEIAVRKRYYDGKEDAIIMEREIER